MADRARRGSVIRQQAIEAGYRSGFEAQIAAQLRACGRPVQYERIRIAYVTAHEYVPDFCVERLLGQPLYIEVKGYFPAEDRRKILAVVKQNPLLDLRIVFQNANTRISSGSKTTYGRWATKNKIPWAHGSVPAEWLA